MMRFSKRLAILGCVVFWVLNPLTASYAEIVERDKILIIGKVSPNPKKHYSSLKSIGEYVASRMRDLGIEQVKVLMAKDNQQMIQYLKQGDIDWVTETIFTAVEFEDQTGAEILVLKHKKGVGKYHSVFFSRRDSGVKSIEDLKGKVVTFEDRGSTSGFFIPASIILNAGLEMKWLKSPRETVTGEKVGYVFANDEINMSTWVNKGLVQAGAFSNLDWAKEDHTPLLFRKNMEIFHRSRSFPRAIELVRKGMNPKIKMRLKNILLAAHKDPEAKLVLEAYQGTTRFDDIDDEIRARAQDSRRIIKSVKENLAY